MKRHPPVTPAPFPYIYSDDPECSLLRNDIRCRKCHWCLRARLGADYWAREQPVDQSEATAFFDMLKREMDRAIKAVLEAIP